MARDSLRITVFLFLTIPLMAQAKRLWVLRATGEMVEYDPAAFTVKQTVKVPAEAAESPQNIRVNREGQILFAPPVSVPLADSDAESPPKAWLWNGQAARSIDLGVKRELGTSGSNQTVTETAPVILLAADGRHLFWFANQSRRLQREDIDLSLTATWQAWQTDLSGGGRQDLASMKLPECRCTTGACEDTCPYGAVGASEGGVGRSFFMTQLVTAKDGPQYKATTRYQEQAGRWTPNPLPEPLRRVLDANADGDVIVEAIPDTGCCGWSNQSDDQTRVLARGKAATVFDELAAYRNPDYDVSFYTSNARLSPDTATIAMTISATAAANQSIQLAEQGQANPEESKQIRKALAELPALEVKSVEDSPRRIAFVPHAVLVGWISDQELLIIENHVLLAYNPATGARRKSTVRVDDAGRVFLR
jgi:hypothetical protein